MLPEGMAGFEIAHEPVCEGRISEVESGAHHQWKERVVVAGRADARELLDLSEQLLGGDALPLGLSKDSR